MATIPHCGSTSKGMREKTCRVSRLTWVGNISTHFVAALDAIASLGLKTVLGVITGHVHGQSWCARGPPSKGIAMW
jgi:hypothetical protein